MGSRIAESDGGMNKSLEIQKLRPACLRCLLYAALRAERPCVLLCKHKLSHI